MAIFQKLKILPLLERIAFSSRFQVAFSVFTIILILLTMLPYVTLFKPKENEPSIQYPYPIKGTYHNIGESYVEVGLHIHDFSIFNINQGEFEFSGTVTLQFNPKHLTLDQVKNFDIMNGVIHEKIEAEIKYINDMVYAIYNIKARFRQTLNYENYPIEDHKIFILFKNEAAAFHEMKYKSFPSGLTFDKNYNSSGWKAVSTDIHKGYISNQVHLADKNKEISIPVIGFEIGFVNPGIKTALILLTPSFVLFYFSLYSLALKSQRDKTSLSVSMGALSGLVIHRFVIERISPKISYFSFIDAIYVFFLFTTFIIFLINSFDYMTPKSIRGIKIAMFYLMQISCNFLILYALK